MSFTFPTSPSVDDTIELNGKTFKWTANGTWDRVAATTSGGSTSGGSTSGGSIHQPDFYSMEFNETYMPTDQDLFVGGATTTSREAHFADDGNKLIIMHTSSDTVYMCDLSTQYEPTTATHDGTNLFYVGSQETAPYSVQMSPDGLNLYVLGSVGDDINQYTLTTAWDLTTATFLANTSLKNNPAPFNESATNAFRISSDGLYLLVTGSTKDAVMRWTFGTAWDVTTLTLDNTVLQSLHPDAGGGSFSVAPDGMSWWNAPLTDAEHKYMEQWTMDSPYDLSTAKPSGMIAMMPWYFKNDTTGTGFTDTTQDSKTFANILWHPTEKKMWFYRIKGGSPYVTLMTEITWS